MTEAYRKDGIVAVVHFRRDGQVYGHTQREEDEWVSYAYLFRLDEEIFRESVRGVEEYDVRQLPALYGTT